jgi:hypothetical protein
MANAIQQAGGAAEPSSFAPLHTNRMFTGLWTNRNPLSDASVSTNMEKYGLGLQDSIIAGLNTELSSKLTLRRRYGTSVYNSQTFPPIRRFYPFNTFTLTDELVHVMADTDATVYDATGPNTKTAIWQKSAAAVGLPTFFLGVGNTLYFTNGVDNKQWNYTANQVWNWGIVAPTTAPSVSFSVYESYQSWLPLTVFSRTNRFAPVLIVDSNANIQNCTGPGVTGIGNPAWHTNYLEGTTDGGTTWQNMGSGVWTASAAHGANDLIYQAATDGRTYFYQAQTSGNSAAVRPNWLPGLNSITQDGGVNWLNLGMYMNRAELGGDSVTILAASVILDPSGNVQSCLQAGRTGTTAPSFNSTQSGFTTDPAGSYLSGQVIWQNTGVVGSVQYGFAFKNSQSRDISNMSPPSAVISKSDTQEVFVQQNGSSDPQVDTIVIYRTARGGSTFFYLDEIPNPGAGTWTYGDIKPDSALNVTIQAQRAGEGTPLPAGATCMAYHLQRTFVAVGNVTYVSSGPDAIASTSSGNAGFITTFTSQSKIIRYWVSPLGLVIFTVRDSYIILGSGTDSDPLYQTTFIDNLPLLHYDAFTTHLTTPYMLLGTNMLVSLDPSAGITEVGFPIADRLEAEFNPATAYVSYHMQASKEAALYVDDGVGSWYRMSATTAPESGLNWSPKATLGTPSSAVQSVEVLPGQNRLLIGPQPQGGPIRMRDLTTNTDMGTPFTCHATFGSIVLAHPGELAQLAFFTLESRKVGSRAALSVLLGEVFGTFEPLGRTRQDPPLLPPSNTLYSDRYHFLQSQNPAWCRHFQMDIAWPAEDAANELLTFTIFGQTWQEYRSQ